MPHIGVLNDPLSLAFVFLIIGSPGLPLGAIAGALLWRRHHIVGPLLGAVAGSRCGWRGGWLMRGRWEGAAQNKARRRERPHLKFPFNHCVLPRDRAYDRAGHLK